ncbi:ATP-dependent zinc metalloprotease FtsH [bacterium]|nr:ATP-dependent zinc metalloprotease FtsH [bacterium]
MKPKKPNDDQKARFFLKPAVVWLIVLLTIFYFFRFNSVTEEKPEAISYSVFLQKVRDGQIATYQKTEGTITATGQYTDGENYTVNVDSNDLRLAGILDEYGVKLNIEKENPLWPIIWTIAPWLIFIGFLWFMFFRQVKAGGGGALSFGKSRARLMTKDTERVTFKDVAGIDEAKEEVEEIIDFLRDPKKFQRLGGRIPKGVLLVGPPGTGKTLLAKAIAGEADVPFFSISGSDFVEMFVGVGASRVRDMFEQGKRNAPCLIFLDEIDAVGRHRGAGLGGGHDEREQTLNQLLVEMDGFNTKEGVILIAATNRPDVLDPALLRPGRFDRQIVIDFPDLRGREQILRVHAKKIKISKDVELSIIARGTPGFSGADLANLINEAALLAARKDLKEVFLDDLEEARDKVAFGKERRSRTIDEKEKEIIAYHEAGHAILQSILEYTDPVHKVTIIPRGIAFLGATMHLPEKDKYLEGKKEILDDITALLGGRVAEEMIIGDITSGAKSDLKRATKLSRAMVCEWGMSEKMGPMTFGEREEHIFLGREISRHQDYSEQTAVQIDEEVRKVIDYCYERAKEILNKNRDKMVLLAKALLAREVIEGKDVDYIVKKGKLPRFKSRIKEKSASKKKDTAQKTEKTPEERARENIPDNNPLTQKAK